jgi:predicted ABC-type transport system involved in lysophospholipase L1 biosynthesis ATPase subunit
MAAAYVERLSIRPANPEARIGSLSGGNQQKAAIARALESDAQVLLIEEPTQGVDVGAKAEIHALLRSVSRERDCARHRHFRVRRDRRARGRRPCHAGRPSRRELFRRRSHVQAHP